MLKQKIMTLIQQKWITKFLGYNFKIHYKQGIDNKVVDALSRPEEENTKITQVLCSLHVYEPVCNIFQEIREGYEHDTALLSLISKIK